MLGIFFAIALQDLLMRMFGMGGINAIVFALFVTVIGGVISSAIYFRKIRMELCLVR